MNFRKSLFWLHLIFGVIAGIVITLMSLTGVALTYEKQITARADRNLYSIQSPANAKPLPAEALIEKFSRYNPNSVPANLTLSADPKAPASITVGRNEITYLNPYTGEILGTGDQGVRKFFRVMTDLHRWLALSGEHRNIGRALTGACNLAFLFIIVSGLYLWWPRKWSSRALRSFLWFRGGLSSKARDSNWHHVFGFWCIIPLILLVASAVVISYPWASNLVFRMAGSQPPVRSGPPNPGGPQKAPPAGVPANGENPGVSPATPPPPLLDLNQLVEKAREQASEWETISFRPPATNDKTISFSIDAGSGIQPQLRSTIIMDRSTGSIIRTEAFKDLDPGLRLRIWFRFVHTGEYYGFAGQTLAGVVSVVSIILVWTGYALSIRRFSAWMKSQAPA